MKTLIGAENIISPLGDTANENFNNLKKGVSGIRLVEKAGFEQEGIHLSKFKEKKSFYTILSNCLSQLITNVQENLIDSTDTIVIISTTKADVEENIATPIEKSIAKLTKEFSLKNQPIIISNACISGVLATNTANNLLQAKLYKHAFVIGADVLSDFVLFGFQSLYAVSDEPALPFDKKRKGISLGEGAAGVVMTTDLNIYKDTYFEFIEGTSSGDANHISGPSRTGEGLYRTVDGSLKLANIQPEEIDFISAHGTGTNYNDEMEAIAFNRLNLGNTPINSLKGFFGHTLGAAGLIEIAICMQSLKHNTLIKSLGFDEQGTTQKLNLLTENKNKEITTILKTASGFGGCNASAIIRKIDTTL